MNKVIQDMGTQPIETKVKAAMFIASFGAGNTGIRTKAQLMHPLREFSDEDSQRESGRFLGSVLAAMLRAMPRQEIDRILKDQVESPFFVE